MLGFPTIPLLLKVETCCFPTLFPRTGDARLLGNKLAETKVESGKTQHVIYIRCAYTAVWSCPAARRPIPTFCSATSA